MKVQLKNNEAGRALTGARAALIGLGVMVMAGCQTTLGSEEEAAVPPPYPPGYTPYSSRIPDQVQQQLPADITPEQVLLADDGCFYYHRGALTYPILDAAGTSRLCIVVERLEQPVDLTGVTLGPVPASSRIVR